MRKYTLRQRVAYAFWWLALGWAVVIHAHKEGVYHERRNIIFYTYYDPFNAFAEFAPHRERKDLVREIDELLEAFATDFWIRVNQGYESRHLLVSDYKALTIAECQKLSLLDWAVFAKQYQLWGVDTTDGVGRRIPREEVVSKMFQMPIFWAYNASLYSQRKPLIDGMINIMGLDADHVKKNNHVTNKSAPSLLIDVVYDVTEWVYRVTVRSQGAIARIRAYIPI